MSAAPSPARVLTCSARQAVERILTLPAVSDATSASKAPDPCAFGGRAAMLLLARDCLALARLRAGDLRAAEALLDAALAACAPARGAGAPRARGAPRVGRLPYLLLQSHKAVVLAAAGRDAQVPCPLPKSLCRHRRVSTVD